MLIILFINRNFTAITSLVLTKNINLLVILAVGTDFKRFQRSKNFQPQNEIFLLEVERWD